MTKQQLNKLAQFWLDGAVRDMQAAVSLIQHAKLYPNGLFFVHLSLEKLLKAIYVMQHGKHAPLTHNLLYLSDFTKIALPSKMKTDLSVINEFNLSTRYPNEQIEIKKKFNKRFSEKYLRSAQEMVTWLTKNLLN